MMGTELSTGNSLSWGNYKLVLVDGRLMLVLNSGKQLELHLENFMNFTWKANPYGKYAKELNILYYSLKGKSLREAMIPLMNFLNEHQLDYLLGIHFATIKNGELHPFLSEWK